MSQEKHYKVLELPLILEKIAEYTSCDDSAEAVRMIRPQSNINFAKSDMDKTECAYKLTTKYGSPILATISNMGSQLRRAEAGGTLSIRELLAVVEVLRVIRGLKEYRERTVDAQTTIIDDMFELLSPNKFLEETINNAILNEDTLQDSASDELFSLRKSIRIQNAKVRDKLDSMIRSTTTQKFLQDPIVTLRSGRFVLPVKIEHKHSVPGIVHDTSSSGSTLFIEPAVVIELNNEIRMLESKEQAEVERILSELSQLVGSSADIIVESYNALIEIDVLFAKARYAEYLDACPVKLTDDGYTNLNKARHPLIPRYNVVPINIYLGKEFDTLIITGPNTGGKTVSIKTLGLLTLMAMCGIMLPVDENSSISIYKSVLADIGDDQSIAQSLSTFSSHMVNIVDILKQADHKTLVLLDELGIGTDPIEGAALATAIIKHLRYKGSKIAVTTHYAELKVFALNTVGVQNACCEFDVETLRPTYKLLIGVPGSSNAFAISARLGLDDEVIQSAKQFMTEESNAFESVVKSLESSRGELEKERSEIEQLKNEIEYKHSQSAVKIDQTNKEHNKILEDARTDANRIISEARMYSNMLLNELEDFRKEKKTTQNANDILNRAKASVNANLKQLDKIATIKAPKEQLYKLPRELKLGDTVLIFDIDKRGTVTQLPDNSGRVEVLAGIIKTKVDVSKLRLIEESSPSFKPTTGKNTRSPSRVESAATRSSSVELDIRGQNIDEGTMELDRFIDSSIMSGINMLTIIHGKGTGVLRKGIHAHLRKHKSVRTFRSGLYGEGEDGVTVVELK